METKLDQILRRIDPALTVVDTDKRIDEAMNTFPLRDGKVESWVEFKDCVTRFYHHVKCKVFDWAHPRTPNPKMDFGCVCRILMKEFGPDGDIVAANRAIHGVEGGLLKVLRILAQRMAEEHSTRIIENLIHIYYWKGLTLEERLAAPREYLSKYGHLLPADVTEGGGARLLAYFPKFLAQHPRLIQKLRQVHQ